MLNDFKYNYKFFVIKCSFLSGMRSFGQRPTQYFYCCFSYPLSYKRLTRDRAYFKRNEILRLKASRGRLRMPSRINKIKIIGTLVSISWLFNFVAGVVKLLEGLVQVLAEVCLHFDRSINWCGNNQVVIEANCEVLLARINEFDCGDAIANC